MLFNRSKSALIVIDVQDYFLGKLPLDWRQPLVERMVWLVNVAKALGIPVIATAEDIAKNDTLTAPLLEALPAGTHVHDKLIFGLCDQADILADVQASGRTEFILIGLETDVCIAHSAIGLKERGYKVAVIEDATGTPPPHHEAGLKRLASAGVTITNCKGIHYEWVRDLATLHMLKSKMNMPAPSGMTL
ncbi:MAG: isochorismatase family protein [Proteobacteria bacterium]|nr:isochorismatase family protein [Pseudomonadota bacterium]